MQIFLLFLSFAVGFVVGAMVVAHLQIEKERLGR